MENEKERQKEKEGRKERREGGRKGNYRSIFLMNKCKKILNKILVNRIQHYIKRILYYDPVGSIPGWKASLA